MAVNENDKTAAESIDAAMGNLAGMKNRAGGLEEIRSGYSNAIEEIAEEGGITAALRELTLALNELYEGKEANISPEIFKKTWQIEAENSKKLREFIRTAYAAFATVKELRDFDKEKGDRENDFLEQWANKVKEKLQVDGSVIEIMKKIFLSDQPNFAELAEVLDAKRASIYAKILPLEHARFRAKVAKEHGKVSIEEETLKGKEAEEEVLLEASIGRILSEEETEEFKNYSTPDQADALYQALQDKKLLQKGTVVLLKFGGGDVYVSWEAHANTAKANLRKELASVQNGITGSINHVQSWKMQREYYDRLPGGTTFKAVSTVDGKMIMLKKNKNGELSAKSAQALKTKENERSKDADPSSQDILANLDHYIVNIDPQNIEETE